MRSPSLITQMDHEARIPPPAQHQCFQSFISLGTGQQLPAIALPLHPISSFSSSHSFCISFIFNSSRTLFFFFFSKTSKLILAKTSASVPQRCSFASLPHFTKKGKYRVDGVAALAPTAFVIAEHGHPHQFSHNPPPTISTLHIPRQQRSRGGCATALWGTSHLKRLGLRDGDLEEREGCSAGTIRAGILHRP